MVRRIALGLIMFAGFAGAAEDDGRCEKVAELAEMIMSARQEGVPMVSMMKNSGAGEGASDLSRMLIVGAYEKPGFSTKENRARAVVDFQNDVYLQCVKEMAR